MNIYYYFSHFYNIIINDKIINFMDLINVILIIHINCLIFPSNFSVHQISYF